MENQKPLIQGLKLTECYCVSYIIGPPPVLISPDAPLELPSFQLTPSQQQVVFQGDSLPFQCQASFVAEDMQVLWYQNGRMVKPDAAQGIFIEKRMVQNCSLIAR